MFNKIILITGGEHCPHIKQKPLIGTQNVDYQKLGKGAWTQRIGCAPCIVTKMLIQDASMVRGIQEPKGALPSNACLANLKVIMVFV